MHRFFIPPDQINSNKVLILGSDVSHIRTVLRLKSGDKIQVLDGTGFCYQVELIEIKKKMVSGQIFSKEPFDTESPIEVTLGQALLKGNKFDQVIRKSVELGVFTLIPLSTERTLIKGLPAGIENKTRRWQKIAMDASKQCGRNRVPEIKKTLFSISEFCAQFSKSDLKLCLWEDETTTRLYDVFQDKSPRKIILLTGPEGGFSHNEVTEIKSHGFRLITLGPRILRAETAPIVALAIVQNKWGDL